MLAPLKKYRYFLLVICVLIIVRFLILPLSPPGFYMDEGATRANVSSMLESGKSAHGQSWPLFAHNGGGGFTTPVYLYPLTAWSAVFGDSQLAIRAFSQFVTIAAIFILAIALRYWLGTRLALLSVVIGLTLPWGWLQGSLAWDPAFVPFFVALSFLSMSFILFDSRQKVQRLGFIMLPVSLIALAYVYPPCRLTAPLLFVASYALLYYKNRITKRQIILTCIGSAAVALPLLIFMLQPSALYRSGTLNVFYGHSFLAGIGLMISNFAGLLNPVFLFIHGDFNLRHSTGQQGMLGVASILPIIALFVALYRQRPNFKLQRALDHPKQLLIVIAVVGIFTSLLSSALTAEGQPHSLRATAAWPFFVITLTIGWSLIISTWKRWLVYVAISIFIVSTVYYAIDLAYYYPARAGSAFDVPQNH